MLISASCGAQVFDMRWIGGYPPTNPDPAYGGNKTIFSPPQSTTSVIEIHTMRISAGMAVMTDANDSIFAYTNGWHLADASHQPMLNGGGLNPSTVVDTSWGVHSSYCQIILPWPEHEGIFKMVHLSPDAVNGNGIIHSARLYYTIIDKDLNGGLAGVVSKNNVILEEPLLAGGLSAVRHANGRDWWILTHGIDNDEFISFILTPFGFEGPFYQSIGTTQVGGVPRASFSPNGDKLAYTGYQTGLDVYDFDRCTGILSNWRHADILDNAFTRSVQVSSDGSLIYVSSVDTVYQYPLTGGLLGAPNVVATHDGFFDQNPALRTLFANMCLAPDGKIYISTGNGTRYMHVIHAPDLPGLACDLVQHEHYRQTWTANSIPYRPNYLLGPIDGTVCDSLGITVGVSDEEMQAGLRAQPNPSNGIFMLRYKGLPEAGRLYIRDQTGRLVLEEYLPPWSTVHQVQLPGHPPGLYHCRLNWGSRSTSVRVILQP
ncbi:MAG: T9SS type A sorting domain-containing protein [Flavobacteriales bacterium]|nr:T9SS type A sorting domain-containing protein [Flavobacteriales bacterium]